MVSSSTKTPNIKNGSTTTTTAVVGRKKGGAGTGLNDMFIAVFGVAFVLSLSLNVMHMLGMDGTAVTTTTDTTMNTQTNRNRRRNPNEGSAVQRAMNDFKRSSSTNKQQKIQAIVEAAAQDAAASAAEKEGEDDDDDDEVDEDLPPEIAGKQQQDENEDEYDYESDDDDKNHLMKLATLDCAAYGGPSLEAAQEMVYWQDIPSDSTYVSPFYKASSQKQAPQQTKYLTFEPDGGGWYVRYSPAAAFVVVLKRVRAYVCCHHRWTHSFVPLRV